MSKRITEAEWINMISHEHRLIFIHIPKCAGTSIERYFGHFDDYSGWNAQDHRTVREIENPVEISCLRTHENRKLLLKRAKNRILGKRNPRNMRYVNAKQFDEYYKFAIIRDPWSRLQSWYRNILRDPRHSQPSEENREFGRFIRAFAGRGMLAPAEYWLNRFDGKCAMDRIVKFDELAEGLTLVAQDLGLKSIDIPHELKAPNSQCPDMNFTEELKDLIERRYENEIERFGFRAPN